MLEEIVVEPARELCGVVDAALQALGNVQQAEIHLQTLLGIAQEEALLEIRHRGALLQPEIGGDDRPSGHAADEVDMVKERSATRRTWHLRLVEAGEHAVREGRSARPAAGKGQGHHGVVVVGRIANTVGCVSYAPHPGSELGSDRCAVLHQRLVDRIVLYGGASNQ